MNLNETKGNELRDKGINQAIENAESKSLNWGAAAYKFLLNYIKQHDQFMCEDVRYASMGTVPEPPHGRAWGAVFVLARKNNIIQAIGFSRVKNPKAHRTPATLWEAV